jgi:DNA-binding transcriptional LysR family regulator
MMKLRKLNALLAVADAGSATQAADQLHATQPAVSSAIVSLEARFGTPLFTRTARGMMPTPLGQGLIDRVRAVFAALDEAVKAVRAPASSLVFSRVVTETQMQAFLALCEGGSYVAAARTLGISQPAVSRSVSELEAIAGAALWQRAGLSGTPTPIGRAMARAIGVAVRDIELASDDLRASLGQADGHLRIGALPLSRSDWLPQAVLATLRNSPAARISLIDGPYSEQVQALQHGRIDLIVGALRPLSQATGLQQQPMFSDALSIVVGADHPDRDRLASQTAPSPDWLATQTWVLPAVGTPGRERFLAFMSCVGLGAPARVIECGSLVATRALLMNSRFAAPLSRRQIALELRMGVLSTVGGALPGSDREIGVAMRADFKPTQLYAALIDALRADAQSA